MATAQAALFQESTEELISGSEAIGIACALADVDVITAYPIRPYDTVMQYVARLKADGIHVDRNSVTSGWHGEKLNLPWAIAVLHPGSATPTPSDVPAGTSSQ